MKLGAFRPKIVAETDLGRNVPLPMTHNSSYHNHWRKNGYAQKWASINHGRTMDETWTIHGQLASILAAQRLRHALSRKRCAARSIDVHERPWHINVPKSHFYKLIL